MIINHNMPAINAYNRLGVNQAASSKGMEKLSSGLRINRAGDDAAGLAISEKMRSQIKGLNQASRNAQDGISLIQTAEGALGEVHSMLGRMKELAVQASNGTNTTDDRDKLQAELNQLTSEINKIGNTTEFNTMKLLNGGAVTSNGSSSVAGPMPQLSIQGSLDTVTGVVAQAAIQFDTANGILKPEDFDGTNIKFKVGETSFTIKFEQDSTITAGEITTEGATQGTTITLKFNATTSIASTDVDTALEDAFNLMSNQTITHGGATTALQCVFQFSGNAGEFGIEALEQSEGQKIEMSISGAGATSQHMAIKNNVVGKIDVDATQAVAELDFSGKTGKDVLNQAFNFNGINYVFVNEDMEDTSTTKYIDLRTLKETNGVSKALAAIDGKDLADELKKAVGVEVGADKDATGKITVATATGADGTAAKVTFTADRRGQESTDAFKELFGTASGSSVTGNAFKAVLQVGANEAQMMAIEVNDMRAQSLGISGSVGQSAKGDIKDGAANAKFTKQAGVSGTGTDNVMTQAALDISTSELATSAISVVDNAIKKVSEERSRLGAYQNRLEYTTNNLNTTSENLTAAESRIRDTDMAKEMMNFTKYNILNQAAQAMLAQANQQPQNVLQLLR